jgi:hypothetical protein
VTPHALPQAAFCDLPDGAVVSAHEVGRFLGVSARTVQRADIPFIEITAATTHTRTNKKKGTTAYQVRRGIRRYRAGDVRAWISAQVRAP